MALSDKLLNLVEETFKGDAKVSKISADMRGKVIVLYGGNNVGKTTQSAKFKNAIFLPFEKGMNAISGALVLKNTCWADFKSNVRTLSKKQYTNLLKDEQITIICDGVEKAGIYCQKYIEQKYDVFDISEAKRGFGAWSQYEKEMWSEIDKLLSFGYTVVFIGHPDMNKDLGKLTIKGDKRNVAPIIDNADIVAYVESNGVDDKGQVIPSSAYLAETNEYFARSRFPYVDKEIKEFTAENLEKAIVNGIKKQQEIEGIEDVSYEEQQEIYKTEETSYEELIETIKNQYLALEELEKLDIYDEIVSKNLPDGTIVSEASKKQIQPLKCIKNELQEELDKLQGK